MCHVHIIYQLTFKSGEEGDGGGATARRDRDQPQVVK